MSPPRNAGSRPLEPGAAPNTTSPATGFAVDSKPYQLLPPLTAEELAALRDDIAINGVLIPITVDQHGTVIDGHHRQHIADQLGIPCPKVVREFASDDERHDVALGLNLKRRHLNREQMRQLIASECERTPDASDREMARRLGCSPSTVGAVRRPVSKLDTPPMSREEAEAWTETIRRHLAQADQDTADALTAGVPPAMLAEAILRTWAEAREQINDAEVTESMWTHMVAPRVEAILNWQALDEEISATGARDGLVAVFREYEGQETDEKDDQGRTVKVTARSFAEHMGIPYETFRGWIGGAS
jgi:ParB-like chromosome segregation protein Spo0J